MFDPGNLSFGPFQSVQFSNPDPLFVGTDDENYGATLRLLMPPPGK
jgi:hypothetical protein